MHVFMSQLLFSPSSFIFFLFMLIAVSVNSEYF